MNRRRILPSLLTALVLLAPPAAHAQQTGPQPELAKQPLVIVTRDGVHHPFSVEVANTIDQQETGLMFRPVVPADGGMLFDWGWVRDSDMWMKNTISSLDMLFIDPDGHVHHIAERTTAAQPGGDQQRRAGARHPGTGRRHRRAAGHPGRRSGRDAGARQSALIALAGAAAPT